MEMMETEHLLSEHFRFFEICLVCLFVCLFVASMGKWPSARNAAMANPGRQGTLRNRVNTFLRLPGKGS